MKVLVAEQIAEEGIELLKKHAEVDVKLNLKPEEIISIIGDYEALVVRSQVKATAEMIQAGKKLIVIGRAGVGVDNIDVEAATKCGIIVVNAPTGNTVSAAEHAIALMLALARHIPQANALLKTGVWKRTEFMGTEVKGKTLGIVGLGKVGTEVARRALAMEMRLIAYDPFISADFARNLHVELVSMETLLKESDFITLHTPLSASTKGLISTKQLAMVKPGVRIINTARGGLVDEKALAKAVKEKRVAGAAIDVFPVEPTTDSVLFGESNIIVTPHLGASTEEAQVLVARDVAEQIVAVFNRQQPTHSVNVPLISAELLPMLAPYMGTAHAIGRLVSQLAEGQMEAIQIKYDGEISCHDSSALKAAVLGGLLEEVSEERVNLVNANLIAAQRGLKVTEQKGPTCEYYSSLVTVEATTTGGVTTIAGTVLRNESHIVQVNNYWLDIIPTGGYFLFSDHMDRPGLLGAVGQVTGDADINISHMHVSRLKPRGQALMVLALDEALPEEQLQRIRAIPGVYTAKVVRL